MFMIHAQKSSPFVLVLFVCLTLGTVTSVDAGGNGVTAREIYRMHQDGLSERVLLEHLNVKGFSGLLTQERVRDLREAGVPQSVIQRMRVLQEKNMSRGNEKRQASSDRGAESARGARRSNQKQENGLLKLGSRTSSTVWFRIDRSNHSLQFSPEEKRSLVGLSKGNSIQLPVPAGTWYVSLYGSDRARKVTVTPGESVQVIVRKRERERITVGWYNEGASGDGRRIVLKRQKTSISKRLRRIRTADRNDRSRTRANPRSCCRNSPSVSYRSGVYGSRYRYGGRLFSPNVHYLLRGPVRIQHHGFGGLNGYRSRRNYGYTHGYSGYSNYGGVFDFHYNLDHDFGDGNLRGSLHLNSGHRNLHLHSSHSD